LLAWCSIVESELTFFQKQRERFFMDAIVLSQHRLGLTEKFSIPLIWFSPLAKSVERLMRSCWKRLTSRALYDLYESVQARLSGLILLEIMGVRVRTLFLRLPVHVCLCEHHQSSFYPIQYRHQTSGRFPETNTKQYLPDFLIEKNRRIGLDSKQVSSRTGSHFQHKNSNNLFEYFS